MTRLNKPVSRESLAVVHECGKARNVVVTIKPPCLLGFRAKGCRTTYWLTADACYSMAVKASVAAEKREKAAKRAKH